AGCSCAQRQSLIAISEPFSFDPCRHRCIIGAGVAAGDVAIAVAIAFHDLFAKLLGGGGAVGLIDPNNAAILEIEVETESRVGLRERGADLFAVIRGCHSLGLLSRTSAQL